MREETLPVEVRFEAACEAAPYVHPKLAALDQTHRGPEGDVI
jgi:hypothetical protein